jgi:hypothetical protein
MEKMRSKEIAYPSRPTQEIPSVYHALDRKKEKDVLAEFTPEQQTEIRSKQQILSSLAYFIGKDFRIPVELNTPGEGWHWDFEKNVIRIDPKDLLEKPMDYLRFVISHEGGHRRISRADFIPLEEWQQPGFSFMMNAIEDPRDNNFVAESYPKFREQMALAYQEDLDFEAKAKQKADQKLGYQPRFMQAGFEYIRQWFRETEGKDVELSKDLPEEVTAVVTATLESAADSWSRYPSRQEADKSEELIRKYAQVSYEINREEIWPEFKKLVEADMEDQRLEEFLKDMRKLQGDEDHGKEESIDLSSLSEEEKQKMKDFIKTLTSKKKEKLAEKAKAALKEFEETLNKELSGKLSDNPEKKAERKEEKNEEAQSGGGTVRGGRAREGSLEIAAGLLKYKERLTRELNTDANIYEKYRREVLLLIDKLEAELREVFVARSITGWKSGFTTGKRVDIKRRIQEKAKSIPAMESKAWQKRDLPQEKDYAISLLVDVSGSMKENGKMEETFKAVIVLAEALNKLGVRVEILGFNDDVYEYQNFGQPMSKDIREHMGGMFKEVEDSRCKACGNEHQETDLGWATEIAAKRLAKQKEENKFLITFSDGRLEESDKHPRGRYEAGKIIQEALEEADIRMIGLGIGRGTGNIAELYPFSIADVDAKEMAGKLAELMKKAIMQEE